MKHGGHIAKSGLAPIFHLFTHAFFKSLLFLGAGAVIHMVHSNEIKGMGGLRKLMPVTHTSFLVACLAIAGIPPFAGFFSKEEILTAAFHANKFIYSIGLFVSGLTAFYMFRLYFSIFWRKEANVHNPHGEGTATMKLPLIVLTAGTLLAGFVPFSKYISSDGAPLETHVDWVFSIAPVALAALAILLAAALYKKENDKAEKIAATLGGLYQSAYKKFYIDEIYLFITQKIIFNLIGRPAAWIESAVAPGPGTGVAPRLGRRYSLMATHTGELDVYASSLDRRPGGLREAQQAYGPENGDVAWNTNLWGFYVNDSIHLTPKLT